MADAQVNLQGAVASAVSPIPQGYTLDSDGTTYDQNVNVRGGTFTVTPTPVAFTDGSGAIAVNATSQQVFAANSSRKYLLVQNNSADTLWLQFGSAAVQNQPSIKLLPNGSYESSLIVSNQTVNIIGPNAGATFTAKQA